VDKKNYTVHVYNNARVLVASYPAGYGLNPDGGTKLHSGDNRTPEGLYHVNEILSMDASPDSPAYKKLRRMNDVFFTARDGHYKHGTNEDLGSNVYGPRFYGIDYPNENDKKRYEANIKSGAFEKLGIGGGIAVHGNNDQPSIGHKSSSGCVRMYNKDVVELERYILIGTPVIIL
jgi:murein L,D-transpeptidase YafK